jgi:putative FmdB family regulatory protein
MPTYEFRCTDCGNLVEIFQRIGDDPLTVCELCGGTLRKVFHPAGIVFKGPGFYATDSRKAKAASSADGKGASGRGADKARPAEGGSEKGGSEKGPSKAQQSEAGSKGKTS